MAGAAAVAAACPGSRLTDRDPDQNYKNFVAMASSADKDGFTAYWLGRTFQAGGLDWSGPSVPDYSSRPPDGGAGIQAYYIASLGLPAGGGVSLDFFLYSRTAWDIADRLGRTRPPAGSEPFDVTIAGQAATLYVKHRSDGAIEGVRIVVSLGDTILTAHASFSTLGGKQVNPLLDPLVFLSVLQNLRPYPH